MRYMVCLHQTPAVRSITMRQKRTTRKRKGQPVLAGRQEFSDGMAVEGFTPGTRKAYGYAFDRFAKALGGKSAMAADVGDAKRYLAGLKRAGASRTVYGNALATLKFFFVKVRGLEWEPVSPLRRRMIEDMRLHGFSDRTQSSYVRAVLGLACHYHRSPEQIVEEEIRGYFVHLTCERKLARPTITIALCGIKFLYEKTLKRDPPSPCGLRRGRLVAGRRAGTKAQEDVAGGVGT